MTADKQDKRRRDSADDPRENAPPEDEPVSGAEPAAADDPAALRAERDALLERLQRVSADYLNYQKRAQRDLEQARQFANEELIKSLLGVLDDMEHALEHARANHDADDPLLKGMELVHDKALATLGAFGLEPIVAVGQPFDPEQHAAMMEEPTDQAAPGTVLRQMQSGYRLKGRTIRPASVVVAKAPPDEDAEF